MQPVEGRFRYRVRELFTRISNMAVPNDRPMPVFTLLAVIGCGGQIIRGFTVVLSFPCSVSRTRWCALGLTNTIVNVIYAIAIMWRMRCRIEEGIPLQQSTFRLFIMEPVNIAFMVYVLWEIIWMSLAPQMATVYLDHDACSTYLSLLLGTCSVFIILGTALLSLTFMTEFCKTPRWRKFADDRWRLRQREARFARMSISTVLGNGLSIQTDSALSPLPHRQVENNNNNNNSYQSYFDKGRQFIFQELNKGHLTQSKEVQKGLGGLPANEMISLDISDFRTPGSDQEDETTRGNCHENSRHPVSSCFSAREGDDSCWLANSDGQRHVFPPQVEQLQSILTPLDTSLQKRTSTAAVITNRKESEDPLAHTENVYSTTKIIGNKKNEDEGTPRAPK